MVWLVIGRMYAMNIQWIRKWADEAELNYAFALKNTNMMGKKESYSSKVLSRREEEHK